MTIRYHTPTMSSPSQVHVQELKDGWKVKATDAADANSEWLDVASVPTK